MRKVIDLQMEFWKKDIAHIEFDLESRDEIPELLTGLQYIYSASRIRDKVFKVLKRIVPKKSHKAGRPGMDLWKILVLGSLRLNCDWDYDKVHYMANSNTDIRQMLGHCKTDFDSKYALQTIRDNIALLQPKLLDEINQIVVAVGHTLVSPKLAQELRGSCDSFVVETDVHFPTDTNVLFDAIRKMISLIANVCSDVGLTSWRQHHKNKLKVKSLLREIQQLKRSTSKNESKKAEREKLIASKHLNYINVCLDYISKSQKTIHTIRELNLLSPTSSLRLNAIEEYIGHAERQIDQIFRRVILEEKIPHDEKVFSLFEPHTEWISKGKAGVPQQLGLRVCVLKDQFGFILHHRVMEKQTDDKVTVSMIQGAKERFGNLSGCSFDKGFYTPENREKLTGVLKYVVLPKKGRLSEKDKQIEHSEEFVDARKKHSVVEASISALQNHGLNRCRDHGLHGFKRYVALSVLARNIQIVGHLTRQKEIKRAKRLKAA